MSSIYNKNNTYRTIDSSRTMLNYMRGEGTFEAKLFSEENMQYMIDQLRERNPVVGDSPLLRSSIETILTTLYSSDYGYTSVGAAHFTMPHYAVEQDDVKQFHGIIADDCTVQGVVNETDDQRVKRLLDLSVSYVANELDGLAKEQMWFSQEEDKRQPFGGPLYTYGEENLDRIFLRDMPSEKSGGFNTLERQIMTNDKTTHIINPRYHSSLDEVAGVAPQSVYPPTGHPAFWTDNKMDPYDLMELN